MFVPTDAVPSAFVGLGTILSSKGVTPFSGCSEPLQPCPGALSLVSQGTRPRLPLECVAAVPCISEND
jgi:ABC-type xylose transport system permease subunit